MIWKIITSIMLWTIYIASAISIMVVGVVLFKILFWDCFKWVFKRKNVQN